MKGLLRLVLALSLLLFGIPVTFAATFVTLSGQIIDSKGKPLTTPSTVIVESSSGQTISHLDPQGKYSINNVLAGVRINVYLVLYEEGWDNINLPRRTPGFSNWKTTLDGLTSDKTLNFRLPNFIQLELLITDAQGAPLTDYKLWTKENQPFHNPYSYEGLTWSGIQEFSLNQTGFVSNSGVFIFQSYPTDDFKGFIVKNGDFTYFSPPFSLTTTRSAQLCLPINFGTVKTTPVTCLENVIAEEKRAKAEADKIIAEKAKLEQRAKIEATKKKSITITCIKGKLTKKVTGVNPKCPAGYKKR